MIGYELYGGVPEQPLLCGPVMHSLTKLLPHQCFLSSLSCTAQSCMRPTTDCSTIIVTPLDSTTFYMVS